MPDVSCEGQSMVALASAILVVLLSCLCCFTANPKMGEDVDCWWT